jgi:hypothetical protein
LTVQLTGDADKVEEAIAFIENQQVEVEVLHPRCPFDIAINDADIHWKITNYL